jgi:hypothetical protein
MAASTQQAERWLALELVTVAVVRTIQGMRDNSGLLGPQQYAAMIAAFAMLSVMVMYQPTAELAAILGLILVLAVMLRPTQNPDGTQSNVGAGAASAIGAFAKNVGTAAPSMAKGAK